MDSQRQEGQICRAARMCQAAFRRCATSLASTDDSMWIRSAQADFNLWSSAIRAIGRGKSSMDYRLSRHPELSEIVRDLLTGLTTSVERYAEIAPGACESKPKPKLKMDCR